jgi:hypothetical protein
MSRCTLSQKAGHRKCPGRVPVPPKPASLRHKSGTHPCPGHVPLPSKSVQDTPLRSRGCPASLGRPPCQPRTRTPHMTECAAEVHLRALAECIRHPERYDLSPRALADAVSPEGAPPMQAHPPANRWAAFTNDELFGLYSIISGSFPGHRPDIALGRIRDECVAELERRKPADGSE